MCNYLGAGSFGRRAQAEPFCEAGLVYPLLCYSASGPEIWILGRIRAGFWSGEPQDRPFGRPSAGPRAAFKILPIRIRPKSGPGARFPARKHHCIIGWLVLRWLCCTTLTCPEVLWMLFFRSGAGNLYFRFLSGPLPVKNPMENVAGAKPPTFPVEFWGGKRPSRPSKSKFIHPGS